MNLYDKVNAILAKQAQMEKLLSEQKKENEETIDCQSNHQKESI